MKKINKSLLFFAVILLATANLSYPVLAADSLLALPWHLTGNNYDSQAYQSVPPNVLAGMATLTVSYNLYGLCAQPNINSALIFDQSGWKYVSLANYGKNCFNGQQTVTIPLADFGLNLNLPLDSQAMFHARFWNSKPFTIDINSVVLNSSAAPALGVTPQHIVMVIEENHDYAQVAGSMPYLNSLASKNALLDQFYANTHPSIGNYFELTTGNIITNDDNFNSGPVYIDNLARQLTAAGKTWKIYAEDLPSVGYTGGDVGNYLKHHNPFAYFAGIQASNIVPFSQFAVDLANNSLPNFAMVVPSIIHDAHNGTLAQADTWLQVNIQPLFNNFVFQQDGLLAVTFDESAADNSNGGGRIYTVLAGQDIKPGYVSTTFYQHQSLLKMVEKFFGTGFTGDAASAPEIAGVFKN